MKLITAKITWLEGELDEPISEDGILTVLTEAIERTFSCEISKIENVEINCTVTECPHGDDIKAQATCFGRPTGDVYPCTLQEENESGFFVCNNLDVVKKLLK